MREHMEKVVPNPSLVPAQQLATFLNGKDPRVVRRG